MDEGEAAVEVGTTATVPAELPPPDGSDFNMALFLVMGGIVLLVCIQNVWLRRRAEGKPLMPEALRRLFP